MIIIGGEEEETLFYTGSTGLALLCFGDTFSLNLASVKRPANPSGKCNSCDSYLFYTLYTPVSNVICLFAEGVLKKVEWDKCQNRHNSKII